VKPTTYSYLPHPGGADKGSWRFSQREKKQKGRPCGKIGLLSQTSVQVPVSGALGFCARTYRPLSLGVDAHHITVTVGLARSLLGSVDGAMRQGQV
jgi:hypothetical protein